MPTIGQIGFSNGIYVESYAKLIVVISYDEYVGQIEFSKYNEHRMCRCSILNRKTHMVNFYARKIYEYEYFELIFQAGSNARTNVESRFVA